MDTILTDSEEVHKIIETHPLHPMCEWHPPTISTDDRRDLFVNVICKLYSKIYNNSIVI